MIFYKFYIGDYQRDTNRLSMTEHGAYRLLLDEYYSLEQPLPRCRKLLYKICHISRRCDKEAVDYVVDNYFEEREDGFHHKRADFEIESAQKKIEKLRLSASLGGKNAARKRASVTNLEFESKSQLDAGFGTISTSDSGSKTQANAQANAVANGIAKPQANFNPSQNQIQNQNQAISIDKLYDNASPRDAPVAHARARATSAHTQPDHGASLADVGVVFPFEHCAKPEAQAVPGLHTSADAHAVPPESESKAITSKAKPKERPKSIALAKAEHAAALRKRSDPVLPDWWPSDTWQQYCEFREQLTHTPLEPRVEALAQRDLIRLQARGNDPDAVIRQSLRKGWSRLYPLGRGPDERLRRTDTRPYEYFDDTEDGFGFPAPPKRRYERPARTSAKRVTGLHSGFDQVDYSEGPSEDGWPPRKKKTFENTDIRRKHAFEFSEPYTDHT